MIYQFAAAQSKGGSGSGSLIFLVVIAVLFYVVAVLPNRRRMKAVQRVQAALEPGRQVLTTAGLYATLVSMDDDSVQLEIAPGVVSRYAKAAVVRVIDIPEPEPALDAGSSEAENS